MAELFALGMVETSSMGVELDEDDGTEDAQYALTKRGRAAAADVALAARRYLPGWPPRP